MVVAGRCRCGEANPSSAAWRCLMRMYPALASSSPTSTVARAGTTPAWRSRETRPATSVRTWSAKGCPGSSRAGWAGASCGSMTDMTLPGGGPRRTTRHGSLPDGSRHPRAASRVTYILSYPSPHHSRGTCPTSPAPAPAPPRSTPPQFARRAGDVEKRHARPVRRRRVGTDAGRACRSDAAPAGEPALSRPPPRRPGR